MTKPGSNDTPLFDSKPWVNPETNAEHDVILDAIRARVKRHQLTQLRAAQQFHDRRND